MSSSGLTRRSIPIESGSRNELDSHIKYGMTRKIKRDCHSCVGRNPETYMTKEYYVYILANQRNGTLYIGITNDLIKRVYQHKHNLVEGFTKDHAVYMLVYYENTNDVSSAIQREKQLKKWKRLWKINLIESNNPDWKDLYQDLIG